MSLKTGVFFISAASLSLEILLLRWFNLILWGQLGYMVISIAMLGYGVSGIFMTLKPRSFSSFSLQSNLSLIAIAFSIFSLLSFQIVSHLPIDLNQLFWDKLQLLRLSLYYFFISIPFFLSGLGVFIPLSKYYENAGIIYGSSLLGSASGCIFGILAFSLFQGPKAIIIPSLLALISSIGYSTNTEMLRSRRGILITSLFFTFLFFSLPSTWLMPHLSPYKALSRILAQGDAKIEFEMWNPYSRVDVVASPWIHHAPGLSPTYPHPLPPQKAIMVDGEIEYIMLSSYSPYSLFNFTDSMPSALPFTLFSYPSVLILGGDGMEIANALYHNASSVTLVEPNSLIAGILSKVNWNSTSIHIKNSNPRRFLLREKESYDLIVIPLRGTPVKHDIIFGSEVNYVLTVESLRTYFSHLSWNGSLVITNWRSYPPNAILRDAWLVRRAMEMENIASPSLGVIIVESWATYTILAKKTPFTTLELQKLRKFCEKRGLRILYPNLSPIGKNDIASLERHLLSKILNSSVPKFHVRKYLFKLSPPTDNSPFRDNYLRFSRLLEFYHSVGGRVQAFFEGGFLILAVFLQAFVLGSLLFLIPLLSSPPPKKSMSMVTYFFFIGCGYMMVEIPLIQQFTLVMPHALYSFAIILTLLLIFSGIGSLLSSHLPSSTLPKLLLGLSLFSIIYVFLTLPFQHFLLSLPLTFTLILTSLYLAPLGILLGIPFPMALKTIGLKDKNIITWAWTLNAFASVLASIIAALIALLSNFSVVIFSSTIAYFLAYLCIRK